MQTLVGLGYSGWTEKARWAMDHHRLAYQYREHIPLLGELRLRRHAPPGGRGSVPLLVEDSGATMGSYAIAQRAEREGQGAPLFPAASLPEIEQWEQRSDAILRVGRAYMVQRLMEFPDAQVESLPPFIPTWARGSMKPMARMAASFLASKHEAAADPEAALLATVVPGLEQLRAALQGRRFLTGTFSYADITMAVTLQFIRPVAEDFIPLGPGRRKAWSHPALAERFADLLRWREQLYAEHRPAHGSAQKTP
ncbi:glutathione S-transferase family protein [Archangium lansingense]|uniref:Glutathione S-transferase N-terminal domain-containing protein n=1 Tax=Archangium lansingense TaxID=2995310 RepID=A0ABT4ACD9_9BACT|nr:glutathione S-transferase C-terminal domain-containing protein [Archangium lansinium]MCY1078562.1 glutathione S-transferase N-terminal domain-containing protein [Archangium lansinium]